MTLERASGRLRSGLGFSLMVMGPSTRFGSLGVTRAILATDPSDEVREHAARLEEILAFYRLGPEDEAAPAEESAEEPETVAQESAEA